MAINYYRLKNFQTRHFSRRSFNEQHDYFVVADVYSASKPDSLLAIVPIWQKRTYGNIIDQIRNHEVKGTPIPDELYQPVPGEFVNYKWPKPLYRIWTEDDVRLGLCSPNKVGHYRQNIDGSYKIFSTVKVFCLINPSYIEIQRHMMNFRGENDLLKNTPRYIQNWEPEYRAQKRVEYCFEEIVL